MSFISFLSTLQSSVSGVAISDLPLAAALSDTDIIPIRQGTADCHVTLATIKAYVTASTTTTTSSGSGSGSGSSSGSGSGSTTTYTASVPSGQTPPGGVGSFNNSSVSGAGQGSISISSGSPATLANQASSVQFVWTRSSTVAPTSGTGPNQYNPANSNDLATGSTQYISAGYPWFVAGGYVWRKPVGSDGGDGTYYLWALPAGGTWFYTGQTITMSA